MTINLKFTWKKALITVVALSLLGGTIFCGRWSFQRLNAAAMSFNYLASAPEGQTKSRAELIDALIKQTPPAGK